MDAKIEGSAKSAVSQGMLLIIDKELKRMKQA
jgi:hypothetical protein